MRGEIHIADVVTELKRDNLLPAIVFRTARRQCDTDAERAATNRELHLSPTEQRELKITIDKIIANYDMEQDLILTHPQYKALVLTGIGAHHAGQLLMWRLLLEELMAAGKLRVLVATGTVAAGVDFPARTVVITAHSRRGSDGFRNLTSAEFQQMSGRAGRRGKDTVGFCVAAPAPFCDARQLLKISKRPAEPLTSAYFPSPSTVLNLLRYRNVDDLRFTVQRSLAVYKDKQNAKIIIDETEELRDRFLSEYGEEEGISGREFDDVLGNPPGTLDREGKRALKKIRRMHRQAAELENRQMVLIDASLNGLEKLGYVEELTLSEKGYWAANLCTSLVLELAETIEAGLMEDVSAEYLAGIVACIAGDPHRNYLKPKSNTVREEDLNKLKEIVTSISSSSIPGVFSEREVQQSAAYTVSLWLQADSWQEFRGVLMLSGVAEGDAARLITQTADHLNQLTRLGESHQKLVYRAEEAKRRILRPPLTEAINLDSL